LFACFFVHLLACLLLGVGDGLGVEGGDGVFFFDAARWWHLFFILFSYCEDWSKFTMNSVKYGP
jgi:hypothetical protein